MATRRGVLAFLVVALVALAAPVWAEDAPTPAPDPAPSDGPARVLVIDFEGEIEGSQAAYMERRLQRAEDEGYTIVVLRIDSPGGTVFHSEKIAERVFGLPARIHTVAWIERQALSGACMVAMACREIVMGRSGTLGDCQPIVMDPGGGGIKPVGEKIESPLRALFRKYAAAHGHPIALAEAFVSEHLVVAAVRDERTGETRYVDGSWLADAEDDDELADGTPRSALRRIGPPVAAEGELLTVTGTEARALGFMRREFDDGHPADEAAMLAVVAGPDAIVHKTEMSWMEHSARFLLGLSGILGAIAMVSLLMTFYQGPGIITIVGGAALGLVFLISATADQVNGFPIFLVGIGIALLLLELLVIPGTGVAGILGFAAFATGFLLLATGGTLGELDGRVTGDAVRQFALQFILTTIAGIAAMALLLRFFPRVGPGRHMVLAAPEGAVTAPPPAPVALGARGVATSDLRPAGSADIDGVPTDVQSDGRFVAKGDAVVVVAVEAQRVTVAPAEDADA